MATQDATKQNMNKHKVHLKKENLFQGCQGRAGFEGE